jgi:hypothetical protein
MTKQIIMKITYNCKRTGETTDFEFFVGGVKFHEASDHDYEDSDGSGAVSALYSLAEVTKGMTLEKTTS